MKEGKASRTAEGMAAFKTAESMKPEKNRIYYDPLAKHFLGPFYGAVVKNRLLTRLAVWYYERIWPGGYGYIITRTRYVDEYLQTNIDEGIEQLVILGAGYDSRPYSFLKAEDKVRVFEVDHPATQKRKLEKLRNIYSSLPDYVTFVPVDFNKEKFGDRLIESGYGKGLKTLFIWEGVTMYLTSDAVDETFSFITTCSGDGSSIIFNYMDKSLVDGTNKQKDAQKLRKTLFRMGEPPIFGIGERKIEAFLDSRGFNQVVNVTGDYLRDTYCKNRNMTVSNLVPIVRARKKLGSNLEL